MTTIDLYAHRRRCNGTSGFLLLCLILMLLCVLSTMLVQMGIALYLCGKRGYGLDTAMQAVLSPTFMGAVSTSGVGYLVYSLVCLAAVWIWMGKPAFSFSTYRRMGPASFFQILCLFLSVQLISTWLSSWMEAVLNCFGLSAMAALKQASALDGDLAMELYAGFLAPVVEEILFRGGVLRALRPAGKGFAIVFSALLFGVFHGNLVQIPFAFLVGLVLGYVAAEYSLGWCILLHWINNCVLGMLLERWPLAQGVIVLAAAVGSVLILVVQRKRIGAYLHSLPPFPRGTVLVFFQSPATVALLVFTLLSTLGGITPISGG